MIAVLLRILSHNPLLMLVVAGVLSWLPMGVTHWCVVALLLSAMALAKTRGVLQRHAAAVLACCVVLLGVALAGLAGLTGTLDTNYVVVMLVAGGLQFLISLASLLTSHGAPVVVAGRVTLMFLALVLVSLSPLNPPNSFGLHLIDGSLPWDSGALGFMGLLFVAAPALSALLTRTLSQKWSVVPANLRVHFGAPEATPGLLIFTPPAAVPAEVRIDHFRHPARVRIMVSLPALPETLSIQRRTGGGGQPMRDPLLSNLLQVDGVPEGLLDGLHAELLSVMHPGRAVLGRGRIALTFDAEIADAIRVDPALTPAEFIATRLQEALELGVVLQARLVGGGELRRSSLGGLEEGVS